MFQVMLSTGQWIYNVPVEEALVYKEEGYIVIRI